MQLLAANDERNGSRLAATARLDLTEEGAAEVLWLGSGLGLWLGLGLG